MRWQLNLFTTMTDSNSNKRTPLHEKLVKVPESYRNPNHILQTKYAESYVNHIIEQVQYQSPLKSGITGRISVVDIEKAIYWLLQLILSQIATKKMAFLAQCSGSHPSHLLPHLRRSRLHGKILSMPTWPNTFTWKRLAPLFSRKWWAPRTIRTATGG